MIINNPRGDQHIQLRIIVVLQYFLNIPGHTIRLDILFSILILGSGVSNLDLVVMSNANFDWI